MKIIDCFLFFNELDLLKIRLEELKNTVNYFVLVESTKTFRGKKKPLYFQKNKDKFSSYNIIHIIVDDMPYLKENPWELERFQRNAILKAFNLCGNEDILIISDVDEIPSANKVKQACDLLNKNKNKMIYFEQAHYVYFLNGYVKNEKLNPKIGSIAIRYHTLKNKKLTPQYLRDKITWMNVLKSSNNIRFKRLRSFLKKFKKHRGLILKNGGWHFSWIGGPKYILEKLESFSHSEWDKQGYKNKKNILTDIERGKFFLRDFKDMNLDDIEYVKINDSFPAPVKKDPKKFKHLIKLPND